MAKTQSLTSKQRKAQPRTAVIGDRRYPVVDGHVMVDEHPLTHWQAKEFERQLEYRLGLAKRPGCQIRNAEEYAHRSALADVLWRYRATTKAKDRLLSLGGQLSKTVSAITWMHEYTFGSGGEITAAGCATLYRLVDLAERQLSQIKHFADSMAMESNTTLEDWMKREEEFVRVGQVVSTQKASHSTAL